MDLEQVKRTRERLAPEDLKARRDECAKKDHVWESSDTTVPQQYCARCYRIEKETGD